MTTCPGALCTDLVKTRWMAAALLVLVGIRDLVSGKAEKTGSM